MMDELLKSLGLKYIAVYDTALGNTCRRHIKQSKFHDTERDLVIGIHRESESFFYDDDPFWIYESDPW